MAKKVYEESNIASIASVIREKTGKSTTYKTSEMPSGVAEVYDAGKRAEYDRFWDAFQQNGKRVVYSYAFMNEAWTAEILKPKHDMQPTFALSMFENCGFADCDLRNIGVTIDTSKVTNMSRMHRSFRGLIASVTIDTSATNSMQQIYCQCNSLQTASLVVHEKLTFTENDFYQCGSLENLTFTGVIGQNGLNLQWSTKLTHDSLMSIINALADKSADTSGTEWFITIGSENVAKLSSEELNIAYNKGWDVY